MPAGVRTVHRDGCLVLLSIPAMGPVPPLFPAPPRRFLPADLDAGELRQLEPLFESLRERRLDSLAAVRAWLRDESELLSCIEGEKARRYVAKTRATKDEAARAAYLRMEQEVVPTVKEHADGLDRHFLASPALAATIPDDLAVVVRRRRTQSDLFRPQNTDLQRQEAELQTQQQALMGGITVEFEGRTLTLQQLAPSFEQKDRDLRERAWRVAANARQERWAQQESIYDRLVALRTEMARNAGYTTYTPYRFLELGRYDYDQTTCRQLHDAIAECVVPAVRELDRERAHRLGLGSLRPWDLEVDPDGSPPLRPFTSEGELIGLCRRLLAGVDPEFATWLDELQRRGLLDLMSRPGKAPGGYQYQYEDERVPFVFANGVGVHADVQTLLHESGHAVHSLLCRDLELLALRDYPIEIAETASMSMELMGLEHLGLVYAADDAARVRRRHLQKVLRTLTWIAAIDAFQHWVYATPAHSNEQRRTAWLDIWRRFGDTTDWSGIEPFRAMTWIRQDHLFSHPFYYIEYGIAQLAALQVWQQYRRDPARAVANYRRALRLGGSRPLPELFAALEVRFDLSATMLQALVDDVVAAIDA